MGSFRFYYGLIILIIAGGLGGFACSDSEDGGSQTSFDTSRFAVISDTHLYDPALGVEGPAFEDYISQDRKLIRESNAINLALKQLLISEDLDFVLVAGDLTKDGVRQSHELMAGYLAEIEASGKQVYVVPGNHDILNFAAHSYPLEGGPVLEENVTPDEFATIYGAFGYDEALERDPNSLTYIAEPTPGVWILAVDSCNYAGRFQAISPTGGDLSPDTMAWIEEKMKEANEKGITVLGLMHHGIVEHFPKMAVVFADYLLKEWPQKAEAFANMGIHIVFTGHHHATDISAKQTPNGSLFDIQTGSALTWRCPYRIIDFEPGDQTLDIENRIITEIDYDTGDLDFQEYALEFLEKGLPSMILDYLVDFGVDEETTQSMAPAVTQTMLAYYRGDEFSRQNSANIVSELKRIAESENLLVSMLGTIMQGIWADDTPDGNVAIDLSANSIESAK